MRSLNSVLRFLVVAGLLCLLALCAVDPAFAQQSASGAPITAQEAYEIGVEAYVYFYPAVTIEVTRRIATNVEAGKITMFGPMNTFSHARAFPTADFKAVVRPNFDTLYSSAWAGPDQGTDGHFRS